ncbi:MULTISPECIES: hypothetical protein [Streptomyces]|uniref:hypothetical protein n=1 Tax=Streptomyces TaxID=1883 RepID=UPI00081D4AAD|nr:MULTISPECIES: hypothetical protein [unclassified Streptomyces]MYQ96717.1 hypothetical protein [Streptomyces sp. SID4946]MYR88125.1 hypothetical protein [Streptomyces sp. SID685]SCF62119.1 hypothetical protein GA0115258_104713 [Streptomyces sp. LamerLS-31b]SCG01761.1 hypothetical protein GA0115256_144111 [Streptomyces sp. DconLS]
MTGQNRHQGVFEHLPGIVRALVADHTPDLPVFKGLVVTGDDRMRLYLTAPDGSLTYGADVIISHTGPGLLAGIGSGYLENEYEQKPTDDPLCDVVVDLTSY